MKNTKAFNVCAREKEAMDTELYVYLHCENKLHLKMYLYNDCSVDVLYSTVMLFNFFNLQLEISQKILIPKSWDRKQ